MANKIKIPFCLFGKIRDVNLFDDAMKHLVDTSKYDFEFFISTWDDENKNNIKTPLFHNAIFHNLREDKKLTLITNKHVPFGVAQEKSSARIAFHIKHVLSLLKNKKYDFIVLTRPDIFSSVSALDKQLDDLIESNINSFNKPTVSVREPGLRVETTFQLPADHLYILNKLGVDEFEKMFDRIYTEKENRTELAQNIFTDLNVANKYGAHNGIALYLMLYNFLIITNSIKFSREKYGGE